MDAGYPTPPHPNLLITKQLLMLKKNEHRFGILLNVKKLTEISLNLKTIKFYVISSLYQTIHGLKQGTLTEWEGS
jgi:hypothetical protein